MQTLTGISATETAIINAAKAGLMVGMDTNHNTATGIVPDHVYVLLGYSASTGMFSVYNPWGISQQLSWAQIAANFGYWSES